MTTINLKDFYYWYTQDQFIEVTEEVAGALRASIRYEAAYSELAARINSAPLKKSKSKRLEDAIAAKEKELAKIMRYKQALYQDWKDGEITRNDYRYMSEDYERQAEALNSEWFSTYKKPPMMAASLRANVARGHTNSSLSRSSKFRRSASSSVSVSSTSYTVYSSSGFT